MTLDEIMSHPVATVEMDDSLKDVKVLLDNAPFHHVLVVESGVLWGVISDRDVYRELSPTLGTPMESTRDLALLNKPVHTFMTRKPITLPKTATLFEAVTLFNHHDISCIPIVDAEKHVLGIVTTHDLLKLLEARRYRLSESMAATDKGELTMIFRQLYDAASSTYTYLLADESSREAILIDPVFEQATRDLAMLRELGLTLKLVADTHAHADHITAAWLLKQKTACQIAISANAGASNADLLLEHGQVFGVQGVSLEARATPGHTNGCTSFVLTDHSMVFTGDALLIRGCGRSDFQQGDPARLYHSITEQLFTLPDDCAVFPAHDYNGRTRSSILEEKCHNPRVGGEANEHDFVEYMKAMRLPHPKKIDEALPNNLRSGMPASGRLPAEPDWAELSITFAGIPEVEPEWVLTHQQGLTVLDVREYDEQGDQVPGLERALLIPLSELHDRVDEVPRDKPVVTICRSGKRSAMATSILKTAGHDRVANVHGGVLYWMER